MTTPMQVGIIGSGDVARSLGRAFITLGHSVMLGSRTPEGEKLQAWQQKMTAQIAASTSPATQALCGSFEQAARFGQLCVVAVRGAALESALALAGPEHFAGKVVIDATNPLRMGPDKQLALSVGFSDSMGEMTQRLLPAAKVVKAFNCVNNAHMFKPDFPGGQPEMFICGNDAEAKASVTALLQQFGWTALDAGGIDAARYIEPFGVLGIRQAFKTGQWNYVLRVITK